MKILRSAIVAAAAASSILMTTTPASAATAGVFHGDAEIGCFGCGVYGPTGNVADFTVAGTVNDKVGTGTGYAQYTVTEGTDSACIISGTADGKIFITVNAVTGETDDYESDFAWTRTGNVAVVTVSGEVNGTASAVFVVVEPHGNPCGGPVEAKFAGVIVG